MKSRNVYLNEENDWKCEQCLRANHANKFAVSSLEKGHILISSCTGCNSRYKLNLND